MIDFRYHLVSIVSIFLALAVGIVLGAGPLKEDIGNTLTSEVKNLRDDKAALRTQLDAADKGAQARDEFTVAINRSLLAGRLRGTTVSIVVLPGADTSLVKSTTDTLTTAGATIGSSVSVQQAWVDPDKATFRSTLGQQLASQVGLPIGKSDGEIIDDVLARCVLTKVGSSAADGAAALESLRTSQLIRYTPDRVTPATLAVVIAGPVSGADAAERERRATAWSDLAVAMDSAGSGAVLAAASLKEPQTVTSPLAVSRSGDRSKVLTTVDDADLPMGQASIVFGLLEQEAGKAGHYGLAGDSNAAFPPMATK